MARGLDRGTLATAAAHPGGMRRPALGEMVPR